MFSVLWLVSLFLAHVLGSSALDTKNSPRLFHVKIERRSVPASRVYAFNRRQWFSQYTRDLELSEESSPHIVSPQTTPSNSSARATYSTPIHGSITPLGEYYATLTFGGQPINVQLDTGSSTMAVPLQQCRNCAIGDHRLDLARAVGRSGIVSCSSRACQPESCAPSCGACSASRACCSKHYPDGCSFSLSYADRSGVNGVLVLANVGISSLVTPLVFGAILEQKSFEASNVDGIFGLAYKSLACNPSCVIPLFDTLVATHQVDHDIFSLCTAPQGGVLTLGGSNPNLYEGSLSYVPLIRTSFMMFYMVKLAGASVGGESVDLPYFTSAIIDSGTTLLVISQKTYNALRDFFQTHYCNVPSLCPGDKSRKIVPHPHYPHVNSDYLESINTSTKQSVKAPTSWFTPGYCVAFSERYVKMLPTISIHMNGYTMDIEPEVYMIPHYIQRGLSKQLYYCLGIAPLPGLERLPNDAIIGDTVLQKYFVEYDREKSRLGFAVAKSCTDSAAVEPEAVQYSKSGKDSDGWFSWVSRVPAIFWIIAFVGIVIMTFNYLKRGGYQPINS